MGEGGAQRRVHLREFCDGIEQVPDHRAAGGAGASGVAGILRWPGPNGHRQANATLSAILLSVRIHFFLAYSSLAVGSRLRRLLFFYK